MGTLLKRNLRIFYFAIEKGMKVVCLFIVSPLGLLFFLEPETAYAKCPPRPSKPAQQSNESSLCQINNRNISDASLGPYMAELEVYRVLEKGSLNIKYDLFGPNGLCNQSRGSLAQINYEYELAAHEECEKGAKLPPPPTCNAVNCNEARSRYLAPRISAKGALITSLDKATGDIKGQMARLESARNDISKWRDALIPVQSAITHRVSVGTLGPDPLKQVDLANNLLNAHEKLKNALDQGSKEIGDAHKHASTISQKIDSTIAEQKESLKKLASLEPQKPPTPPVPTPKGAPQSNPRGGPVADSKSPPPSSEQPFSPSELAKMAGTGAQIAQGMAGQGKSNAGTGNGTSAIQAAREPSEGRNTGLNPGRDEIGGKKNLEAIEKNALTQKKPGNVGGPNGSDSNSNVTTKAAKNGASFASLDDKKPTNRNGTGASATGSSQEGGSSSLESATKGTNSKTAAGDLVAPIPPGTSGETAQSSSNPGFLGAGKFSMDNSSDSENIKKILADMEGNMGAPGGANSPESLMRNINDGSQGGMDTAAYSEANLLPGNNPNTGEHRGLANNTKRASSQHSDAFWGDFDQPIFQRVKLELIMQQRQGKCVQVPKEL